MVWRPVGHRQDLGIYRVQPEESSLPCAHLWCYLQTQRSFAAPPGPSLSSPPSHLCASAPQSPLPGFTRADTQRPGEHLRGARPYRGAGGTATKPPLPLWGNSYKAPLALLLLHLAEKTNATPEVCGNKSTTACRELRGPRQRPPTLGWEEVRAPRKGRSRRGRTPLRTAPGEQRRGREREEPGRGWSRGQRTGAASGLHAGPAQGLAAGEAPRPPPAHPPRHPSRARTELSKQAGPAMLSAGQTEPGPAPAPLLSSRTGINICLQPHLA